MISFSYVNKWFGTLHVLRDINLRVELGEVVVVCGPSGSGKSTLLRCINRLEEIQKGEIIVDNMKVHDRRTNMTQLRAEIGFVFQQFNLYPHMTALENVTIAPIKVRKQKREEAERLGREILEEWGWETGPIPIRPNFREDSSSGLPLPEGYACGLKLCSLMNRPQPSIQK